MLHPDISKPNKQGFQPQHGYLEQPMRCGNKGNIKQRTLGKRSVRDHLQARISCDRVRGCLEPVNFAQVAVIDRVLVHSRKLRPCCIAH